jgi:hypothetical protein
VFHAEGHFEFGTLIGAGNPHRPIRQALTGMLARPNGHLAWHPLRVCGFGLRLRHDALRCLGQQPQALPNKPPRTLTASKSLARLRAKRG